MFKIEVKSIQSVLQCIFFKDIYIFSPLTVNEKKILKKQLSEVSFEVFPNCTQAMVVIAKIRFLCD